MKKTIRGFTLIELLVVLAIAAMLLLLGLPNVMKYKSDTEVEQVIAKAVMLNNSKVGYLGSGQRRALETAWASYSNDQRYVALKPFLSMPPADLGSFVTAGYTLTIGGLYSKTTITRDGDGQNIDYQ